MAKLCSSYCVPHIINNAYGVQAPRCMNLISEADRIGRVDAFVQSTDKNFLVPVGGAVVASSNSDFIKNISQTYPGKELTQILFSSYCDLLEMYRGHFLFTYIFFLIKEEHHQLLPLMYL